MFIRYWYHGPLKRLASVAHMQTNDPVVCPLSKYVATDQQEPIVVSEVFIKLARSPGVRVVRYEEVDCFILNVRIWIRVRGCEIDPPIVTIPGCITPTRNVFVDIIVYIHVMCAYHSQNTHDGTLYVL